MCSPPLVGREAERRQLREAAVPATIVLLAGTAGTGKTRLVQELHEATSGTVLTGHCPPRAAPFPYAPVIEALHEAPIPTGLSPLCGALAPLLPEHGTALPPPLPPVGPAAEHHRTYRALTELLGALGPAVLVLEDMQWIDPPTRDLLAYLAPRLPPNLTLVLTYRPEELPHTFPVAALAARTPPGTTHHEITLGPLSVEHVHTLAQHLLTTDPTDTDARRLHTWTGGLPLAVVETLHHLSHLPTAPGEPAVPTTPPVPAPLRDWILDQLRSVDRDTRRLVRAACVLDRPATDTQLARVADLPETRADRALARAHRHGLLHPTDPTTLAPRTPLLRQACYTALPRDKRRHLHRASLHVLGEQHEPPHDRMAHHAREAGLLDTWTDHAEHAADQALTRGEDATAVALLRDALNRDSLPPQRRCALALKLGRAALTGLSAEHTIDLLRDVLDTPGLSATERGELRMELGLLLLNQASQNRSARGELVRAAAELSSRPALAARVMCALAVPRSTPDPVSTHRRWMEQAVAAAQRSQDPAVDQTVRVNQATLLAQIGDPTAWEVTLPDPGTTSPRTDPQALARRREFARASLNLADAAVILGHYDRADRHLSDATGSCDPYIHESARVLHLILDWNRGHWSDLAERTEHDLRSRRLAHLHSVTAELTVVRAALALAQGDPATARTHLERILPGSHHQGPDYTVPVRAFAAGLLARLALAQEDPNTAWKQVEGLVSLIASKGIWVWAADLVPGMEALLLCRRQAVAQDLCTRLRAGLRGTSAPAAQAALVRFEAALAHHRGHHDRALHLYTEAEAAYREMPRPYDAALAREASAHTHLASDRRQDPALGVTALQAALAEYTELGATWDAARVRRRLREHGVAVPPARSGGTGDNRLSPRENEITVLAAQGHTNREIAALLHLSPRTVETHVANALAKLGLRSRRDLTAPTSPEPTTWSPTTDRTT
ncbi:LuxR family transcriptional regulator [Nocardiopsis terrae]|uniref:DNA-binding CsgD family transcriptional regulator n=1 Tax=Nocardiopsis terrae TaxID=372655 RepID=A0ABR9HHG7_9ACTN|nr:AAA family ATPase [Nocardiopsis terrae]MBE1458458.1 DNA-binding CsgD family transcriptional regulator [Nocardiopsis terrae]GHC80346.1 LuxR family transcriptional regulator [Nocardiopsis terrae]